MKMNEISTVEFPSVFCYDLYFDGVPFHKPFDSANIEVDLAVTEVTIKGVKRTSGGLSVHVSVILVSDTQSAITRTAKAARVIIDNKAYPSVPTLVSDIIEVRNLKVIHHSLEKLENAGR